MNQQVFNLFTEEGRWRLVPIGAGFCGLTLILLGLNVLLRVKVFGDAAWGTIMTLVGLAITTIMSAIFFSEESPKDEGNEEKENKNTDTKAKANEA